MKNRAAAILVIGFGALGAHAAPVGVEFGADRPSVGRRDRSSNVAALAEELARLLADRPTRWTSVFDDGGATAADQAAWLRWFSKHVGGDFRASVRRLDDQSLAAVVSALGQMAGASGASGGQPAASPSGGSFAGGGTGVLGDGEGDWDGLDDIRPDPIDSVEIIPTPVPLPSGAALGLAGLLAIGSRRRRSL